MIVQTPTAIRVELTSPGKPRELAVEGLRGLAALMVVYTHLLAPFSDVDPGYAPSTLFWKFEAGQGAVLFFFVLSGYVIGITNSAPPRPGSLGNYAWRRVIRLVPLYLLAVGLSVAIRPTDSFRTIAGNLVFLQNTLPYGDWHAPLLSSNTNLWSLNYEVLYYILFPLIWITGGRGWAWLVGAGGLGIAAWCLPISAALLACYAAGWAFWLAGYCLAQAPRVSLEDPLRAPWPSLAILWLVTWHVKPLWYFTRRFEFLPSGEAWMNFTYYDFIPVCVALLMVGSGRLPRLSRMILYTALFIPLGFLLWRTARGRLFADSNAIDDALCLVATGLWWFRPSTAILSRFASLGAISYGLYIFQRPAQWLIRDAGWLPSGSVFTLTLRIFLVLVVTLAIAWITESRLQPWIRGRLLRVRASDAKHS